MVGKLQIIPLVLFLTKTKAFRSTVQSIDAVFHRGSPLRSKVDGRTPEGIASLLDKTFVAACTELSTGNIDSLKLFIASAVTGYERQYPVALLVQKMADLPNPSAGRPLYPEEEKLRQDWASLVYQTANAVGFSGNPTREFSLDVQIDAENSPVLSVDIATLVDPAVLERSRVLVDDCLRARQGGWTVKTLTLAQMLEANGRPPLIGTSMERALAQQAFRVIFLTMTVLDEIDLATGRSIPQPNIPGAQR